MTHDIGMPCGGNLWLQHWQVNLSVWLVRTNWNTLQQYPDPIRLYCASPRKGVYRSVLEVRIHRECTIIAPERWYVMQNSTFPEIRRIVE